MTCMFQLLREDDHPVCVILVYLKKHMNFLSWLSGSRNECSNNCAAKSKLHSQPSLPPTSTPYILYHHIEPVERRYTTMYNVTWQNYSYLAYNLLLINITVHFHHYMDYINTVFTCQKNLVANIAEIPAF